MTCHGKPRSHGSPTSRPPGGASPAVSVLPSPHGRHHPPPANLTAARPCSAGPRRITTSQEPPTHSTNIHVKAVGWSSIAVSQALAVGLGSSAGPTVMLARLLYPQTWESFKVEEAEPARATPPWLAGMSVAWSITVCRSSSLPEIA